MTTRTAFTGSTWFSCKTKHFSNTQIAIEADLIFYYTDIFSKDLLFNVESEFNKILFRKRVENIA